MPISTLDTSAIIPFKDHSAMTYSAVKSLLDFGPALKEILLISNNSTNQELDVIKQKTKDFKNVRVLEYNEPFNYQKMNNWAVRQSSGKTLLFMNNDIELTQASTGLLDKMYGEAQKDGVGITGCLLLYGDKKTIQHAGVFLMPKGTADHLYVGKKYKKALSEGGLTKEFPYSIQKNRKMTAVTGAVNIIERKKFDSVGGFDENFIIGGGDVDLCIRLNEMGYQTWFIADGYIVHKESQSRAHKPIPYSDFYYSYFAYLKGYDQRVGDPYLPEITKGM